MKPIYLYAFLISFVLVALITPLIRRLALKLNIVDYPAPRKIHDKPVAYLGGVAIFLGFIITILAFWLYQEKLFRFSQFLFLGFDKRLFGLLLGGIILVIIGILDDKYSLKPWVKFLGQITAAAIIVMFGIGINNIPNPFGQPWRLDIYKIPINFLGATYHFVPLADLFTIFWLLLLINAMNFLDGLDGLAAGVSAIGALTIFFLAISLRWPLVYQSSTAMVAIILAGCCLGFLIYNFHPAKIFMGDSGSMFLGFVLGVLAIISGSKIATTFLVLGIPILDAVWAAIRRILHKKPFWLGDKEHLHHRLLSIGLNQKKAVLFFYVFSLIFGLAAFYAGRKEKVIVLGILLVTVVAIIFSLFLLELNRKRGTNKLP